MQNAQWSENNPSSTSEEIIGDINHVPLKDSSLSQNVWTINRGVDNNASNDIINNSPQSTNSDANNNADLSGNNPRNRRYSIDLTGEDFTSNEDEDSITNPDLTTPSSKLLWPKYTCIDSNWTGSNICSKWIL